VTSFAAGFIQAKTLKTFLKKRKFAPKWNPTHCIYVKRSVRSYTDKKPGRGLAFNLAFPLGAITSGTNASERAVI